MLEQENSSRSSPASRGQVKQVPSWFLLEELCLGSLPLPRLSTAINFLLSWGCGDRTVLLSRLDSRAREGPVCDLTSPASV